MARFLFATIGAPGHVNPGLPIARTLVERGHDVWWYSASHQNQRVSATGARFVPMRAAPAITEQNVDELIPERRGLTGLAGIKVDLKRAVLDSALGQVQDLEDTLQEFPADVLVSDSMFLGSQFVSERGGPPCALWGVSVLAHFSRDTAPVGTGLGPSSSFLGRVRNRALNWFIGHAIFRDVNAHLNTVRGQLGLPPVTYSFFDTMLRVAVMYLQPTAPEFEYPMSDLPRTVHFIGPLLPDPPADFSPPAWWSELQDDRPVVLVTQGTVATDFRKLLLPTLQALADEDVLVVATTGSKVPQALSPHDIPGNARVEQFLSYHHLLPHVDVMVTNGGYGGVQFAMRYGVPVICSGRTEDKLDIGCRVEWSGLGINLRRDAPSAAQVRRAVSTILRDPAHKRRAEALGRACEKYDAAQQAATLLERLATTKKPVLRAE